MDNPWSAPSPWLNAVTSGDPEALRAIDDLPYWSAPFGRTLLETVRLRRGLRVLDVGCGAGFPLLELAACLGPEAHCTGLDPWAPALAQARAKALARGQDVTFLEGAAETMPFENASFDLLISNNGLNNVENLDAALAQCARVATSGAQLAMTANLPPTFEAFYQALEEALTEFGCPDRIEAVRAHRAAKRLPAEAWIDRLGAAGFRIRGVRQETFAWTVLDGTTLFQHPALRLSFLPAWVEAVGAEAGRVFSRLEARLNRQASTNGPLRLDVPFLCLDAERL